MPRQGMGWRDVAQCGRDCPDSAAPLVAAAIDAERAGDSQLARVLGAWAEVLSRLGGALEAAAETRDASHVDDLADLIGGYGPGAVPMTRLCPGAN